MKVPDHILSAVNALLKPYGETFSPGQSNGCLSAKDAAAYLGVSKQYLYRLIAAGNVERVKLTPGKTGKAVIPRASLDAFLQSRRERSV